MNISGVRDPITFQVIRGACEYASEEMGIRLRNSAYSSNIKDREDHSCAIFDWKGRMIAQAEHIPVHLGAMPATIKIILQLFEDRLKSGDMIILNDPFMGGTHLPDITLTQPIFFHDELVAFTTNRAHHSDIGGITPGSMPPNSTEIFQEGLRISPVKLIEEGIVNDGLLRFILTNVRTPKIRKADLLAQVAANRVGEKRILHIIQKYGLDKFKSTIGEILDYSNRLMQIEIGKLPIGVYQARDYLESISSDDPNQVNINVKIIIKKHQILIDFHGTDPQVAGPINAPLSVTTSACYFVIRSLTHTAEIPVNEGAYRPISIIVPFGSILNPKPPAAVVGGNVETSQRIVDVLFKAFSQVIPEEVCAASQGTMNNIAIGGQDPKTHRYFSFYETIGGGFGGRHGLDGIDAIHSHMTNTANTPIEEIEQNYPMMIEEYKIRADSGGAGKWRGGNGLIRSYKFLTPIHITILAEGSKRQPWGLSQGKPGKTSKFEVYYPDGTRKFLPSKYTSVLMKDSRVVIKTPGGGGYGDPRQRSREAIQTDIKNERVTRKFSEKYYPSQ